MLPSNRPANTEDSRNGGVALLAGRPEVGGVLFGEVVASASPIKQVSEKMSVFTPSYLPRSRARTKWSALTI